MDNERQLIISALKSVEARLFFCSKIERIGKKRILSSSARHDANKYYETMEHDTDGHAYMFNSYSLSIAYGPNKTEELAFGYFSRAIFLLHLNKPKEAIEDIERALDNTNSNILRVRAYCIQTRCYTDLEKLDRKAAFEKAKFFLGQIDDQNVMKKQMQDTVNRFKKYVDHGNPKLTLAARSIEPKSSINIEEILSLKETENIFRSVVIRYDEKNGRHLVAARNIKAGEVIGVLKPYAINSNTEVVPYLYCGHCLKMKWNCLSCDDCGWGFFCSEECKKEAVKQYHEPECPVLPWVRQTAEIQHLRQLTMRTLIIAIKQAGSIAALRRELEEVDKCTDERTKGFSSNGKFENDKFISLYSLISRRSANLAKVHANDAVKMLISFIKLTDLFGKQEDKFKVVTDIIDSEDAIFVGSLILRLFGIFSVNYQQIWENNDLCLENHEKKLCLEKGCCYRGVMISPLFSLINHSCNPNAAVLFTDVKRLVLVALKPIKKKEQIFQAYGGCGLYYEETKDERQWMCNNAYNFTCDCEACVNNWPLLQELKQKNEVMLSDVQKPYHLVGENLKKLDELLTSIKNDKIQFDELTLRELGNAIEIATRNYKQPSFTINTLVNALLTGYKKLFLKKVEFPDCDHRHINL